MHEYRTTKTRKCRCMKFLCIISGCPAGARKWQIRHSIRAVARRRPLFHRMLEKWVLFSLHLRIKPVQLHTSRNRYRQRNLLKRIGGRDHAESEYHLHIRAAVGEPAAHLPLRHDHGGSAHGQVKDNGQINMALCCDFRCGTSHCVTPILSLTLVVRCDSKNSTRS